MNDSYEAQKKQYATFVLTALVLIIFSLLVLILVKVFVSRPNAYLSEPFAQNIRFPYVTDATHLYFYTGHGFASLDVNTYKTEQLGSIRVLPSNPTNVGWLKDGSVIQTSSYTILDELGSLVPSDAFINSADKPSYVWFVPFDGKPMVVAKNVTSSYIDQENRLIYYSASNKFEGETFARVYSLSDHSYKELPWTPSEKNRIVYVTGDSLYVLEGEGTEVALLKIARADGNTQTILDNVFASKYATVNDQLLMVNDSYFVAVQHNNKKNRLITYDINKKKTHVLDEDFDGFINSSGGSVFASKATKDKYQIDKIDSSNKHRKIVATEPNSSPTSVLDFGEKLIVTNRLTQASVMSANKEEIKNVPAIKGGGLEKAIDRQHLGSLYDVSIDLINKGTTNNAYAVLIYDPHDINMKIFLDDTKKAGYDPNQLDFVPNYTTKRL